MRIIPGKQYAVVTGDIVGSSKLPDIARQKLHRVMKLGGDALMLTFSDATVLDLDIFRGDSWQLVIAKPSRALRIALFYRAFLRSRMEKYKTDTRMAIGIGQIDFIPDRRVSNGDGPAFRLSGRMVDSLPRNVKLSWGVIGCQTESVHEAIQPIVQLIDVLAAQWSWKQALAVLGALQGFTQEQIAQQWRPTAVSQQAIAQHLDRSGWHAIQFAVDFFEKWIEKWDCDYQTKNLNA